MNPMQGVSIPKGRKHGRKRQAYSLEEIQQHHRLFSDDKLLVITKKDGSVYRPELAARVVGGIIGAASFAGMREGELRGLWWEDDDGDVLNIQRSVWRTHLKEDTKTGEDEPAVAVIYLGAAADWAVSSAGSSGTCADPRLIFAVRS